MNLMADPAKKLIGIQILIALRSGLRHCRAQRGVIWTLTLQIRGWLF
jgi:hypothetical protein